MMPTSLIQREQGTADKREVLVELTEDGRRLHRHMSAIHGRDIGELFTDRLSAAQQSLVEEVFRTLLATRGKSSGRELRLG